MYCFKKIRIHITHNYFEVVYCGKTKFYDTTPPGSLHVTYSPSGEVVTICTGAYTLSVGERRGVFNITSAPPIPPCISEISEAV
jgi:hypothetical protein